MEQFQTDISPISLREAAEFCGCSQDVLNVHIRRGKLKAIKIGRNWATTREWLNEYIQSADKNAGQIHVPETAKKTVKIIAAAAPSVARIAPKPSPCLSSHTYCTP